SELRGRRARRPTLSGARRPPAAPPRGSRAVAARRPPSAPPRGNRCCARAGSTPTGCGGTRSVRSVSVRDPWRDNLGRPSAPSQRPRRGYIRAMRTTASFDLFPDVPSERAIARARWLAQQGRVGGAEPPYGGVPTAQPDLEACWAECFELLRRHDRAADALRLAEDAVGHFGPTGLSLTLQGAALIELGRYREALGALEQALERDPDPGMAWHELGYAAHRMGNANRALLALDRAFAIEPHTETLRLRAKILRDAGRYQAAEVSFEAAAQTAEH